MRRLAGAGAWRPALGGLGLGSLRLRLLAGFGLVIGISLLFAGFASVWLLRDQQAQWAEQRIGRLVPTLRDYVIELEIAGYPRRAIRDELVPWAHYVDVRVLLIDQQGRVVLDTEDLEPMLGERLSISSVEPEAGGDEMQSFRAIRTSVAGEDLYLFTPSSPLPTVRAGFPFRQPQSTVAIAVPATDVTSAWAQLLPRFAIAGGMAAIFAVVVATLLSARITRPVAAMTRASEAMAAGDYDQRIDVRGDHEVATLAHAFNQMAGRVSRSSRAMRQLLANVSHELKTPLTSIQGFSQAIVDGVAADPEEQKRLAGVIHEEAERMRGLVDDLLYLSSIESGELALTLDEIDLDALIDASVRRFAFQAEAAGVTVRSQLDGGRVTADGGRLEQVLANLLDNALRFAPAGSEVTVSARSEGGDAVIAVRNRGEPIPAQELPQVFDRFYQADPARSDGAHSGLGLAIVRELAQAHGGRVSATSTRADGTTFTVRLPRGGPAPGASEERTRDAASDALPGT